MHHLPPALAAMSSHVQFMIYRTQPSTSRAGKTDKFPCSVVTGEVVSAHNAQHWVTADVACIEATRRGAGWGVAFVLTDDDPFFFIDIDSCLVDGQWSKLATDLCARFAGAAVEVSQSGSGLHIIGTLSEAVPDHGCRNDPLHLECYTEGRFIALTGSHAVGNASAVHDTAFSAAVGEFFTAGERITASNWITTPAVGSFPIMDDDKLIEKALNSTSAANAFGARASFADLWNCNVPVLESNYPDEGRGYDASAADAALAQHLAFWTGGQCDRIEQLMRKSCLVRTKWDKHRSYMSRTICGAVAKQSTYYSVGAPLPAAKPVVKPEMRAGYQYLAITQVIEHFDGCVYVADAHRILTPNGTMLKTEQFNAMFGGYSFALDDSGEKTTKKAWEAFTESQGVTFPKVDGCIFRPIADSRSIIEEEGRRLVNIYVPIQTDSRPGDVAPFLTHLRKILPDQRDQLILLSYMAACVQYKGYKIQWAPLIQGCEGNGKTLFTRCVAAAIGQRYTHMPPAKEIDEKFNSWLFDKLFIGVEDIYVPEAKVEILEVLKPMITGNRLARRAMQQDQVMAEMCANFMFNSNHRNAIKKTLNDRRFAVMYTAQQHAGDLVRDGMDGSYFPHLYDWLNGGGYAHVTHYLENYAIPVEFNPTLGCQRAPVTSSTADAVAASLGGVEQEVLEAIDEGRAGFCGGWVSSYALDRLIEKLRAERRVPRGKRRELMKSLGYDYHPALKDGRVNNPMLGEGANGAGKPRLYINEGHIHTNLHSGAEVARYYQAAQGDPLAMAETSSISA
jgi:hypothetical protein